MRVLKGLLVSLKTRMPPHKENSLQTLSAASGGEHQRNSIGSNTGYSAKAQRTGAPAYLEPNSSSMQEPIGGRSALAAQPHMFHPQVQPIYRGGIDKNHTTVLRTQQTNQNKQKLGED